MEAGFRWGLSVLAIVCLLGFIWIPVFMPIQLGVDLYELRLALRLTAFTMMMLSTCVSAVLWSKKFSEAIEQRRYGNNKGFTLVELMVCMVILGIIGLVGFTVIHFLTKFW